MASTRQLAAIMFTDIVGYTALMGKDSNKALAMVRQSLEIQKPLVEKYHGKWLKEMGDGALAQFSTALDAVNCAIEIQRTSRADFEGDFRIGIHLGDITIENDDVYGDGVNIASRLESIADPGGIYISESIEKAIRGQSDVQTKYLGEVKLKNVAYEVRTYALQGVGLPEPSKKRKETSGDGSALLRRVAILSYLVIAAVVGIGSYYLYIKYFAINGNLDSADDHKSIAVLAFDDQSPNGDQEWLGDGLADEILNVLAQAEGLKVSGKTSSFSFKGKDATIKEIGDALNVSTVLEGSVSKVGNKLRITAQLIDVESEAHIWSDKYDRDATDIFVIVDEVAQNIVRELMSELSVEDVENIKMVYQVNEEAYEYYLKGIHFHWNKFVISLNENDFNLSEQMFLKAISIDSTYAEAYAGLADLYDTETFQDEIEYDRQSEYDKKRDSVVDIGYKMNRNSAYVLMTKGFSYRKLNNLNLDSAFYYFKKAHGIDPNNVQINNVIVGELTTIGLYEMAISLGNKIILADPLNAFVRSQLALSLLENGQIPKAKNHLKKILEIVKNHKSANRQMFMISLIHDKDTSEAKRIYETLRQIHPDRDLYRKALLLGVEGKKEKALNTFKSVALYSILDMKKEGLYLTDSLCSVLSYTRICSYLSLKNTAVYDFIRNEPEFIEILNSAKIVHEERMRKFGHLFDDFNF